MAHTMRFGLAKRAGLWAWLTIGVLLVSGLAGPARAYEFTLGGVNLDLQEVSTNVGVYFTSMRLNRAANEWDFEVSVSNQTAQSLSGPLVLLVDSFSGISGPLRPDGVSTNQVYFDLSGQLTNGVLAAAARSAPRTLGLGYIAGATPHLVTRVFAGLTAQVQALGFSRTLNQAGQPLAGVTIVESGPSGVATNTSDPDFGVVTLGHGAGAYAWKFSLDGYLPVWRSATLSSNAVSVVAYPWLTARNPQSVVLSPLTGGTLSNASVQVQLAAGSLSQNTTGQVSVLDGQGLPAFLPAGWSPLQAFWLELGLEPSQPAAGTLVPWGSIGVGENAALVKLDPGSLTWQVLALVPGNGTNALSVNLPGSGAYALVVADGAPIGPPAAVVGSALQSSSVAAPDPARLQASGTVNPSSSAASLVPELVTATADVLVSNTVGSLASGTLLRGEVSQQFLLNDGTFLTPPIFDSLMVGYERPAGAGASVLDARFALRPVLLFGPERLNQGLVHVDMYGAGGFSGGLLDTNGGLIASGAVRLLAGPGAVGSLQAIELRSLEPTNFSVLAGSNLTVEAAFEVGVGALAGGQPLSLEVSGLASNASFVLAKALMQAGVYGLEPRQRLVSDGNGQLSSVEPAGGLAGLNGSGEYVLLAVAPAQGLVSGVARNSSGQAAGGLAVRIAGQPWLTFSAADGSFKLLAPAGSQSVSASDLVSGDSGSQPVSVPGDLSPVSASVGTVASGLEVVSVSPTNGASGVPQVSSVSVTFNRPVNPATLLSNAVVLLGASNAPVALSLSLDLANTTATLLPGGALDPGTVFQVVLSTNLADMLGRTLSGTNQFSFTTVPLSARDPAAQLIIYEPGATNVPATVVTNLPGFAPGTNKNLVVVQGTPGAADPGVPVIIVNEASGESTTVLSQPDGSFASYVHGAEQDFISATFVSLNGARIYMPVNRQLFDDGSVALYRQGGTLEAQGATGPVQIQIPPNSVPDRTKFKLDTLNSSQLQSQLSGVSPDGGVPAAGGLHIHVEGQPPTLPMQASFPVDLAALGFPTNQPASNAVVALTVVRDTQDVKTFEVLDQMAFSPTAPQAFVTSGKGGRQGKAHTQKGGGSGQLAGFIFTVSGFAPGAIGLVSLVYDWIIVPTLLLGLQPVVITGHTYYIQVGDPKQGQALLSKQQLSGTYVVLRSGNDPPIGLAGRLQPGWVYATSGDDGSYTMLAPFAGANYGVTATHPLFQDIHSAAVIDLIHMGGAVEDFSFNNALTNQLKPRVSIANAPQYPSPGQPCQIEVNSSQSLGGPPKVDVQIQSVSSISLLSGKPVPTPHPTLTNKQTTDVGNSEKLTATLMVDQPVQVVLSVSVQGAKVNLPTTAYPVDFSTVAPPPAPTSIPPSDPTDTHGPLVVSSQPAEQGFVDESSSIQIVFNKPIDASVTNELDGIILKGPNTPLAPLVN